MCGYIGSLSLNKINQEKLKVCNENILCRGPDSTKTMSNIINGKYISAIFNRLSIIDLSNKADQPMFSENREYMILFNGEIYNHKLIRLELEKKGYKFRTDHSDTETLLYAFIEFGEKAPNKLRGQFSLVFTDFREEKMILCRDRVGQKPLFYTSENNTFSFSSDLTSLSKLSNQTELEESSIYEYLQYGKTFASKTIYENILELEPGCMMKVDFSKKRFSYNLHKYWKLEEFYNTKKFDEEEFIALLEDSVEIRTQSDVPYATFLSGGLDSTTIVKSQFKKNYDINTFSVHMGTSKYDESKYSQQVVDKYSTNHISLEISNFLSTNKIQDYLLCLDQPYSDPSIIPTYLISSEISKFYKMAISGDGGDELLGGYLRVQKSLANKNNKVNLSNFYKYYPPFFGTGNIFLSSHHDLSTRYNSYLSDKKLLELLKIPTDKVVSNRFDEIIDADDYKNLMYFEYSFFLPKLMMYKIDRASMFNSIEVRSPFVDNKLIEYIFSHSNEYYNKGEQKQILKNYISKDFDKNFKDRKKQGFVFNLEEFVYNNSEFFFEAIVDSSNMPFIDNENVEKLFKFKTRINSNRIWKIFVLNSFLDQT
jgi:asparagine synthase (glutamine-hydrolysing)